MYGTEYLHVWKVAPGYTFCSRWAEASVFSDIIELDSSYLEFEDSNQTALKSITIPKNSSAYKKLIEEQSRTFTFEDKTHEINYIASLFEDEKELRMDFNPAILENPDISSDWYRSDRQRLILRIFDEEWVISKFEKGSLQLAKEKENAVVYKYDPDELIEAFNVSGKKIVLERLEGMRAKVFAYFCELEEDTCKNQFNLTEGDSKQFGQESFHLWRNAIWWPVWVHASVFSDTIELNSTYLDFEDSNQTALKSITIPKDGSVYVKILGN
jgi:hypothetical protein